MLHNLLYAIKDTPSGSIYHLAPPEVITNGASLFRSNCIDNFVWSGSELNSYVIDNQGNLYVLRLIMRHTIEEKIMLLKEMKRSLYNAIIREGVLKKTIDMTKEDIEFLLSEGNGVACPHR